MPAGHHSAGGGVMVRDGHAAGRLAPNGSHGAAAPGSSPPWVALSNPAVLSPVSPARTRRIADGRVRRMLAEAYALCYALTGLALGRAMAAAPVGALGALACVASWALALLYAYFRVVRRIKSFELPGSAADGHDL